MGQVTSTPAREYPLEPSGYQPRHDPTRRPAGMTAEECDDALDSLDRLASFLESAFHFGGLQVGWDTIIGFIPGVGDVTLLAVSTYIQRQAARLEVPRWRRIAMGSNAALDFAVGLLPLAGPVFSAWFACNRRNVNHILIHLGRVPHVAASVRVQDNSDPRIVLREAEAGRVVTAPAAFHAAATAPVTAPPATIGDAYMAMPSPGPPAHSAPPVAPVVAPAAAGGGGASKSGLISFWQRAPPAPPMVMLPPPRTHSLPPDSDSPAASPGVLYAHDDTPFKTVS